MLNAGFGVVVGCDPIWQAVGDRREMAEPKAERVGFMILMNTVEPMQPVVRADELEGYWERRVF